VKGEYALKKRRKAEQGVPTLGQQIIRSHTSYIMLAPFAILFLMFTIIPVIAAICISFTSFDMVNAPVFVGLENYTRMVLDDEIFIIAIKNTLIFAFLTGPLGYVLSFVPLRRC